MKTNRLQTVGLAILLGLSLVAGSAAVQAGEKAPKAAESAKPIKVLMLTQSAGFKHGSVSRKGGAELSPSEVAMTLLGRKTELFSVDCTQDASEAFTIDNLKKYDIVFFYTTGKLPIADDALEYLLGTWLKQPGHGFIGFHSATDTYKDHAPYYEMIGGTFNGHPWGSGTTVTISVHDTQHPTMKPFGEEFQIKDEIYQYKHWVPENVHVLMSLNMEKCKPSKPYHVPVAWCKQWGDGKIFVNNLGHNPGTWEDQRFLDSVVAAVRWIRGTEEGSAKPNPEVSKQEEAKAKAATEGK